MNKKQMVWHAYHAESLCQIVDPEERRVQIEEIKPEHELPTRRRLMKAVVGDLPEELVAAGEAYVATWVGMGGELEKWKAWKAAYQTHKAEIERLHAIECPDCPWDGETIFPEEVK